MEIATVFELRGQLELTVSAKFNTSAKKVEYLTHIVRKEHGRSVGARARTTVLKYAG